MTKSIEDFYNGEYEKEMTTKDRAIAPHMNTCNLCGERWWDSHVCSFTGKLRELIPQKPPAPDCRTCNWKDYCKDGIEMPCTNGDQYQPAPKVVLWRTE